MIGKVLTTFAGFAIVGATTFGVVTANKAHETAVTPAVAYSSTSSPSPTQFDNVPIPGAPCQTQGVISPIPSTGPVTAAGEDVVCDSKNVWAIIKAGEFCLKGDVYYAAISSNGTKVTCILDGGYNRWIATTSVPTPTAGS